MFKLNISAEDVEKFSIKPTPKKVAREAVETTFDILSQKGYQEFVGLYKLEPCAGNGVFIDELLNYFNNNCERSDVEAFELNDSMFTFLDRKYMDEPLVDVYHSDFLQTSTDDSYDIIIGGLPFADEKIDAFIDHSLKKCYLICCFVVPFNYTPKHEPIREIRYEHKGLKTIYLWHE